MKLLLILISFCFLQIEGNAQKNKSKLTVTQEFEIYKKFGWSYKKLRKQIVNRRKGTVIEHLIPGKKIIEYSVQHSDFTEYRFYVFSNGKFLDGFQSVTTYQKYYSTLRQTFDELVILSDGQIVHKQVDSLVEYNPMVPTRSLHSYYNVTDRYFITFGAKHEPDLDKDDLYSISIYRNPKQNYSNGI